jgi:hypothetical protein
MHQAYILQLHIQSQSLQESASIQGLQSPKFVSYFFKLKESLVSKNSVRKKQQNIFIA